MDMSFCVCASLHVGLCAPGEVVVGPAGAPAGIPPSGRSDTGDGERNGLAMINQQQLRLLCVC